MARMCLALGLVACVSALAAGEAVGQAGEISIGTVTATVVSPSDSTQRYALYVPSAYRPDRAWPVVVIMDPRGRALIPLGALEGAAESLGYILISSYNTVSDGSAGPNELAVAAMIDDVQGLFSVDTRRLYFVGLSGTARMSWTLGNSLAEHTAGVIGFGAGLPSAAWLVTRMLDAEAPFAFFGGAGDLDFNYEEVLELDWALDSEDFAHVVEFYAGPHAWPPPEVFEHSLDWMEVRAVRSGLRDPDPVLLERLYRKRVDHARALEADGSVYAAALTYRDVVTSFDGLVAVDSARHRSEELARSGAFRATETGLRASVIERRRFDVEVRELLLRVRETGIAPDVKDAVRRLEIERLQEEASTADQNERSRAAQRMLEALFVRASFYEPRGYVEVREFEIAVALYRLADVIKPHSPPVCLGLGQAYAQLNDFDRAFEALDCLSEIGSLSLSRLESDPLLAPLRSDGRFADLLARLR